MTDQQIRKLAIDIAAGQVFGSWQVGNVRDLGMVFMVLALGGEELHESLKVNRTVHVYEYLCEAGPRSVNGMPIFMSMRRVSESEWAKLVPLMQRLEKRQQAFVGDMVSEPEPTDDPDQLSLFSESSFEKCGDETNGG